MAAMLGTGPPVPDSVTGSSGVGPRGPRGPAGPPGKVELVTCKTVTTVIHRHHRRIHVHHQRCTGRLISGTVKFTLTGGALKATLSRGHTVYATGVLVAAGRGGSMLILTHLRGKPRGRFTLTLTTRHGERTTTHTAKIMIE